MAVFVGCGREQGNRNINGARNIDTIVLTQTIDRIMVKSSIQNNEGIQSLATELTSGISYNIVGIPGGSPCIADQAGGLWRTCCDLEITNNTGGDISGVVLIGWQPLSGSPSVGRTGGNNSGYDGSGTGWRTTDGSTPNPSANGGWALWLKGTTGGGTIPNGATSARRRICLQSPTGYSVSLWKLFINTPCGQIVNSNPPPNLWARLTNSTELGSGNLVYPDPDGYFAFPEITLTDFVRDIGGECIPVTRYIGSEVFITAEIDTRYWDYLQMLSTTIDIDRYVDQIYPDQPPVSICNGNWIRQTYTNTQAKCLKGGEYRVSTRTGSDPSKALLFLSGGGACYQGGSVLFSGCEAQTVNPTAFDAYCPGTDNGIFDLTDSRNPFSNWNMVFAPCCDGSVFSGDNDPVYNGVQYYHRGLKNLSSAITQLKTNFPNATKIVISGESCGGYGTLFGALLARTQYPDCADVEDVIQDPAGNIISGSYNPNIYVITDSGLLLENVTTNTSSSGYTMRGKLRNGWQIMQFFPSPSECEYANCCFNTSEYPPNLPDPATNDQIAYMINWILDRDPKIKWGYMSFLRDEIMGGNSFISGFLMFSSGTQYRDCALMPTTKDLRNMHPARFKRFFPDGTSHTMLSGTAFYSTQVSGKYAYQWVNEFVSDSPNWDDRVTAFTPGSCSFHPVVTCY